MKKKKVVVFFIVVILIIFFSYLDINYKRKKEVVTEIRKNENQYNTAINETNETEVENNTDRINELKEENGFKANNNLYVIDKEYDGREVLNIKKNIQYKVAFAGIAKNERPKLDEINEIYKDNHPLKKGIWIQEKSKEKILELLKENTNSEYSINDEGYLYIEEIIQKNDNDKLLEKAINSNKKIILTISDFYYEVDSISGQIIPYPFEKLDNYQACDKIENEDSVIIIITTNSNGKLTSGEIMKEVLRMLKEEVL